MNPTFLQDENDNRSLSLLDEESVYERERLKKIKENTRMLLSLGLISELDQENQNDESYLEVLLRMPLPSIPLPVSMIIVPHVSRSMTRSMIQSYRNSLVRIAQDSHPRLCHRGFFVVGVQDLRLDGKLWPMGLLVLEDIQREVPELKLKEFVVAVPEGFTKDRNMDTEDYSPTEYIGDAEVVNHMPIVHVSSALVFGVFVLELNHTIRRTTCCS
jgi:hypothetical protein